MGKIGGAKKSAKKTKAARENAKKPRNKKNAKSAGSAAESEPSDEGLRAVICSLDRWPTVEEVRANYLREGYLLAHALVEGFSDYHPTVVAFSIGGDIHRHLVCACFYDRMSGFVREFSQQSGIRLTWLVIPPNV